MNSLGLEYGSSSDEEDNRAGAAWPSRAESIAVAAPELSTVDTAEAHAAVKTADLPVKPAEKTVETNVSTPVTTGVAPSMDDEDDEAMLLRAGIPPPATPLADDDETQQRIERFLRVQRERGQDFQTTLQDKKEVRNPYILEKVVEYFGIDELQSNFSPDVFDPHGLPLHEFADALALEQKKRADARAQRQLQQQRSGADPRQLQFVAANSTTNGG
ncbi:Transcriptional regulator [Phytophthora cinnamomi]|uniref:Transcriptional regulator n=1 Tax=Phytophthora cinnamomi TaxID=4785 RepID=UPI0035594A37|nr:Transcriptional regulator [Phytophthora cinnamomi]